MAAVHTNLIHLHKIISTPYTMHADWESDAHLDNVNQEEMLEIAFDGKDELRTMCVQKHRCISRPVPQGFVMLTKYICDILHVGPTISPVIPHKVLVKDGSSLSSHLSKSNAIISMALASLVDKVSEDYPDLVLCPNEYSVEQQNIRVSIVEVKEEEKKVEIDSEDGQERLTDGNEEISLVNTPCIWLSADIISALGLHVEEEVLLYQSSSPATRASAQILQHPGFCYLAATEAHSIKLPSETVIRLDTSKSVVAYLQIHAPLDHTNKSFVDPPLADALQVDKHSVKMTTIDALLYWASALPLDDVQNKARAGIGLSHEGITEGGYNPREKVQIFHGSGQYMANIEQATQPLANSMISATALLRRTAKITNGQGIFVSTNHIPFAVAKAGILNVDELEEICAMGSEKLASVFKMPCLVELQNVQKGTSVDILLKKDPYPRVSALVRLARTTRQMLLLERGDEVVVRPILAMKDPKPIRTFLLRVLKAPLYRFLLIFIRRRRIFVSLAPAHAWDDQSQVVRIDPEALTVLGISDGDHIRIRYRGKSISRITVSRDSGYKDPISIAGAESAPFNNVPLQFQMGMDAIGRYKLGAGELEFGTIVEVERDMLFILQKSFNLALLPIIGAIISLYTFFSQQPVYMQVSIGVVVGCALFYLTLSSERSKVA